MLVDQVMKNNPKNVGKIKGKNNFIFKVFSTSFDQTADQNSCVNLHWENVDCVDCNRSSDESDMNIGA